MFSFLINTKKKRNTMALRKSVLMMTNTGTNWNLVGDSIRADAFYGYTDGLHTVQIIYSNFVGSFGIQGTLALNPQPEDWFWIRLNPNDNVNNYINYPIDPLAPTGSNGGDTGSMAFSFIGNFTYLRAVLNRDSIQPTPVNPQWDTWTYGEIDKVLLSL
jgi:hypothetical protein